MAMKKIKPQYGRVTAPIVKNQKQNLSVESEKVSLVGENTGEKQAEFEESVEPKKNKSLESSGEKTVSRITGDLNPFLQTKEVFGKARLTKIGYRMRSDYVEILDIIKKIKRGGYTLEAVLDDALTFYFENSEDGREAIKKAEIFYS